MSKVKLDRILFDFMEIMTKKKECNYEFFIHNLADTVEYFNDFRCDTSEFGEIATYFDKYKREETLEKLIKAYVFGYEQEVEVDKNTNAVVVKYAIWGEEGRYDISIEKEYGEEDEPFIKQLTFEEILNKYPKLWPFE